ncbi:MAG: ribosomal protein S18-alanine N-acetyltransferase [Desulfurococcales archaeon]|nr:ribosomal protein S18-alanine N-acetyltransferase [Desulfurococcales archaeon]MEB3758896.1 ribosomal protein S18-alanine N-acetyltransferase [Desulfurococcales archaeon]MEB3773292.1 ribosomal protein S18-alanine N-acetyltransferase [Desulfurococcales archaeon]MEB3786627.1 ribosomal protein S18-alanine N-acetyltransferase [Desulfurococcales archaeon]MEB3799352.1 ribosomal protein S18-alanine N-acetyltransferase [Desulfurococcales archaeon]
MAEKDVDDCIIRPVLPSELVVVKGINEAVLPENYPTFFYYDVYRNWGDVFLVALCDGRIVGYIMNRIETKIDRSNILLWKTVKVGHVISIAVLPEYRNRGLGSRLLEKAIDLMKQNYGIKKVYLEVRISNEVAINLYKKFGFTIKERIPRYYRDGEDAYLMEKELEQ